MPTRLIVEANKNYLASANSYGHPIAKIQKSSPAYAVAVPMEVLPFRIRFANINVGGYDSDNPAPIGIAVIGFNNYIL